MRRLEGQARSASAKLAYLLGLDPCTEIVPADETLVALSLADADVSCCELVAKATTCGPGVREMEAILCLIHKAMQDAAGPQRFLPVMTAQALEGSFGAGRNGELTFANRFDHGGPTNQYDCQFGKSCRIVAPLLWQRSAFISYLGNHSGSFGSFGSSTNDRSNMDLKNIRLL